MPTKVRQYVDNMATKWRSQLEHDYLEWCKTQRLDPRASDHIANFSYEVSEVFGLPKEKIVEILRR